MKTVGHPRSRNPQPGVSLLQEPSALKQSPTPEPSPTGEPGFPGASRANGFKVLLLLLTTLFPLAGHLAASEITPHPRPPAIAPDYAGIVLPPNIAPLNFAVQESGTAFELEIASANGRPIQLRSKAGDFRIPLRPWAELLQANRGQELWLKLSCQATNGLRASYAPITNRIALEPVDPYLAYRRLHPQYSLFGSGTIGIYQRNLQTFDESPILALQDRTEKTSHCVNCHTFLNRDPQTFALHLRSADGKAMLLTRNGQVSKVDLTAGYMSWHPSGRFITFSRNKLSLFFHCAGETRDVYDEQSDLGNYHLDSNRLDSPPAIAQTEFQENWPMWSQDGRYLYFSRTRGLPFEQFNEVRYDLMRVSYDLDSNAWGTPELLVSAEKTGRSLLEPRPSPDGRFLLFTSSSYGHFPIYQKESQNWILDLKTAAYRPLEINSGEGDTWHCWSSNSRWVVFSSKRLNRLLTRPFFSYIDDQGHASKPFVLPQQDPVFYDNFLKTFNVPEFVLGPVTVHRQLFHSALDPPDVKPHGTAAGKEQTDEAGPARR